MVKYPECMMNTSKGNISIMFAATADGTLLTTYNDVYKTENLWTTWCENGPDYTRYNRSKSGWFDSTVFQDWFKLYHGQTNRMVQGWIIGDNLSSHLNVDIVRECEEHVGTLYLLVFLKPEYFLSCDNPDCHFYFV